VAPAHLGPEVDGRVVESTAARDVYAGVALDRVEVRFVAANCPVADTPICPRRIDGMRAAVRTSKREAAAKLVSRAQ